MIGLPTRMAGVGPPSQGCAVAAPDSDFKKLRERTLEQNAPMIYPAQHEWYSRRWRSTRRLGGRLHGEGGLRDDFNDG